MTPKNFKLLACAVIALIVLIAPIIEAQNKIIGGVSAPSTGTGTGDAIAGSGGIDCADGGATTTCTPNTAILQTRANAQSGVDLFCPSASGSSTLYTCAMAGNALPAYTLGMVFRWRPDVSCTGTPSLDVDTKGAKSLKEIDGTTAMACSANTPYQLFYDGTNLRSLGASSTGSSMGQQVYASGSGNWTIPAGVTRAFVELWGCGAGGGAGTTATNSGGGGGAGGYTGVIPLTSLTPGGTIPYALCTPGVGGATSGTHGTLGGNTTFGPTNGATWTAYGGGAGGANGVGGGQGRGMPWFVIASVAINNVGAHQTRNDLGGQGGAGRNSQGAGFGPGAGACVGGGGGAYSTGSAFTGATTISAGGPAIFAYSPIATQTVAAGGDASSGAVTAGAAGGICNGGGGGGANATGFGAGGNGGSGYIRITW